MAHENTAIEANGIRAKKLDGITLIALFWALTAFLIINQGVQTLLIDVSYLPFLSDLSAEVWTEFSAETLEWVTFGLPASVGLSLLLIAASTLILITIYGFMTRKSWSYKLAFIVPILSTILCAAATAVFASSPLEFAYDVEFTLYFPLTFVNLMWVIAIGVYVRRSLVKVHLLGTPPPLQIPIAAFHFGTHKGDVLKATIQQGRPVRWRELQKATNLNEKDLNYALFELIDAGDMQKKGSKYVITDKLKTNYQQFLAGRRAEFSSWITQWKKVRNLSFPLEHDHFFLEGRHLDDFSKELISHAKSEVLVVNPFIQNCDLSNTLRDVQKRGINVQIITRPPHDRYPDNLKQKQDYHASLQQDGISVLYEKKVHAKLLMVDQAVAVVSSMNFYPESSAGVSWEAGLVSTNPDIIESIMESVLVKFE